VLGFSGIFRTGYPTGIETGTRVPGYSDGYLVQFCQNSQFALKSDETKVY